MVSGTEFGPFTYERETPGGDCCAVTAALIPGLSILFPERQGTGPMLVGSSYLLGPSCLDTRW